MANLESDAFVFFGATGDLASKQIFPALQAMIRHGHLDIPIIGVGRSAENLDQLRAHARESLEKHGGVDARAFSILSAKLQYVKGDYNSQETLAICEKRSARHLDLFTTWLSRQAHLPPSPKDLPSRAVTREHG
jgi:glucose-6-phosphate 1-dehydrogenase